MLLLPFMLPMEPSFRVWVPRAIKRWQREQPGRAWPAIRIGAPPGACDALPALLREMAGSAASAGDVAEARELPPEGSQVPTQKRRVLVCQGGPCNNEGAALLWGHLRNEMRRLDLRTTGDGAMVTRASCLGPCALGPVLQLYPEGTVYGGVDEAGIDRIVAEHLQGGRIVEALAYAPSPSKQRLRNGR